MSAAAQEILTQVPVYFRQQAELYGTEFYFTEPLERTPGAPLTLASFYEQIKACRKCRLASSRKNFVFGVGNPNATLMCVGEGPGFEEDQQGEPFVGPAGQLLNKILGAIGFARQEVYIANVVKCRPPGNRTPEPDEMAECLPYLEKQIELVQPRLILALGKVAAQGLLGVTDAIGRLRGQVHRWREIPVVVTYHPAALLRNPQWKRATWEDVKRLRQLYDETVGDKPKMELK